jgi:hypothetical protein
MDFFKGLELKLDKEREELRGLFVLGIIATLLTSREFLDFPILGVPTRTILLSLILSWGAYAFFMVIAISGDWVKEPIVKVCYFLAYNLFVTGISATIAALLFVTVAVYVFPYIPLLAQYVSGMILGIGVTFFLAINLGKGPGFVVKGEGYAQEASYPEQGDE